MDMENKIKNNEDSVDTGKNVVDSIKWKGKDGALLLLFFFLVVTMFVTLYFRIDFLMGYVFPFLLLIIVCCVTVNYAMTIGGFIRMQNQKIKEGKEVKEVEKE